MQARQPTTDAAPDQQRVGWHQSHQLLPTRRPQGKRNKEVNLIFYAQSTITVISGQLMKSQLFYIYNYTMVKVRLFSWWCCVCCIVLLTLCSFFFYEPAMTTTKLPLVGWLKFFLNWTVSRKQWKNKQNMIVFATDSFCKAGSATFTVITFSHAEPEYQ